MKPWTSKSAKKRAWKAYKGKSQKKRLREKIGVLHLKILKIKRHNFDTCEICGRKTDNLGRFHIIPISHNPRLEFVDENILLTDWFPCHYRWHHEYKRAIEIEKRIKELRGEDYETTLREASSFIDKHSLCYYDAIHDYYKQELEKLKN